MVPTAASATHVITPGGPGDATIYSRNRHLSSTRRESFRGIDRLSPHHPSTEGAVWGERLPRRIGHRVRVRLDRRIGRASYSSECSVDRNARPFGSFRFWVSGYQPGNAAVGGDSSECGRFDISELSLDPRQFFGCGRVRQRSGSGRASRSERQPVARDQRRLAGYGIRPSDRARHGLLLTGTRLASCAEGCRGTNRRPVQRWFGRDSLAARSFGSGPWRCDFGSGTNEPGGRKHHWPRGYQRRPNHPGWDGRPGHGGRAQRGGNRSNFRKCDANYRKRDPIHSRQRDGIHR
jgi:hypothetical protein